MHPETRDRIALLEATSRIDRQTRMLNAYLFAFKVGAIAVAGSVGLAFYWHDGWYLSVALSAVEGYVMKGLGDIREHLHPKKSNRLVEIIKALRSK